MINSAALYTLGIALIFVGVLIIIVAVILLSISSAKKGKVKGGGTIIIGPIPIVIGAGPDVTWIVLFSIILVTLSVVMFLVMNKRLRRFGG